VRESASSLGGDELGSSRSRAAKVLSQPPQTVSQFLGGENFVLKTKRLYLVAEE